MGKMSCLSLPVKLVDHSFSSDNASLFLLVRGKKESWAWGGEFPGAGCNCWN